jgi:tRNA G18 (ribose-2'-O)-methylase SpoU
MGHVLRVPFATVAAPDWSGCLARVRGEGFVVAALTPAAGALDLRRAGLAGRRVAVLLGSEGYGLTEETLVAADLAVRIPMTPGVDSLNVATAAAVAFHEIRSTG